MGQKGPMDGGISRSSLRLYNWGITQKEAQLEKYSTNYLTPLPPSSQHYKSISRPNAPSPPLNSSVIKPP